jgi:hypothetical protein
LKKFKNQEAYCAAYADEYFYQSFDKFQKDSGDDLITFINKGKVQTMVKSKCLEFQEHPKRVKKIKKRDYKTILDL